MNTQTFSAPWSALLKVVSALATVLLAGAAAVIVCTRDKVPPWLALLPLLVLGGAALFTIRSYTLAPGALLIQRLFWTTRLPLAGLQSAEFQPNAMRSSLRLFGNGGLFSFTGIFRNRTLGNYRAYVTDPHRTVVLRFSDRTLVVSPERPEEFTAAIPGFRA